MWGKGVSELWAGLGLKFGIEFVGVVFFSYVLYVVVFGIFVKCKGVCSTKNHFGMVK